MAANATGVVSSGIPEKLEEEMFNNLLTCSKNMSHVLLCLPASCPALLSNPPLSLSQVALLWPSDDVIIPK